MRQPPLQRTVAEQVYEHVRQTIHSGELVPGKRIDQAEVARQFGSSIVPVREALARLQADGLVRIVPHRGAFVEQMSPEDLAEVYQMRELLESEAGGLAAARLDDAAVVDLTAIVQRMDEATGREDYPALFALNREFHFIIYGAAGRRQLFQLIRQLWDQGDHYRRVYTESPERARTSLAEHRAILDACQRRDAAALSTIIRYHVHQTIVGLSEYTRAATHANAHDTFR